MLDSLSSVTAIQVQVDSLQAMLNQYSVEVALLNASLSTNSAELNATAKELNSLRTAFVQAVNLFSGSYRVVSQEFSLFKEKEDEKEKDSK